ncbi:hypothetical protein RDI58_028698 [Solanum bulbocastanum]|uniref:Uncharacterized protein n=1 Tax=Solanum bulbocastanum TaxID=147425 RepID=A0AAN8SSE0_SOLBU
MRSQEGSGLH